MKINTGTADASAVRSEILRTLSRVGHRGRVTLDIMGGEPRYLAYNTIIDQSVTMRLDPDQSYIASQKKLRIFLSEKAITEPVVQLGNALARHEAVHTEALIEGKTFGCPGTIENHYELFMEQVIKAMQEKGKDPNAFAGGRTAAAYIANIIQDLIDDYACQKIGSMDADMLFMYEQGMKAKYTKIYEAFSKLYAFINGQKDWNKLLKGFYTNDESVNNAVAAITRELGLQRGLCDSLLETGNWKQVAYTMASHLADLLEYDSQGNVIIIQLLPGGMHEVEPPPSSLAYERYVQELPLPLYMKADDSIWDIYWEIAERLEITAEGELKTQDLPIIPITHQVFDPDRHDAFDIDPFTPVWNYGEAEFGVPDYRMSLPIPLKERKEGYPSVNIALLDRSISMTEDVEGGDDAGATETIPWGDKSKYHFLYLGVASIVKGLFERNILDQVSLGGLFFGSTTDSASGFEEMKRTLSNPEFQSTTQFDIDEIRQSLGDEPTVFATVSDGQVWNWPSVRKEFLELASKHYFFHIQIGKETKMTRSLRKAGLKVLTVNNGDDLVRNLAQVTLQIMDEHTRKRDY